MKYFTDVSIATTVRKDNLTLTHGKRYYVTVEATNGAGMTSHGWSDGFLVDVSRPELTEVRNSFIVMFLLIAHGWLSRAT